MPHIAIFQDVVLGDLLAFEGDEALKPEGLSADVACFEVAVDHTRLTNCLTRIVLTCSVTSSSPGTSNER